MQPTGTVILNSYTHVKKYHSCSSPLNISSYLSTVWIESLSFLCNCTTYLLTWAIGRPSSFPIAVWRQATCIAPTTGHTTGENIRKSWTRGTVGILIADVLNNQRYFLQQYKDPHSSEVSILLALLHTRCSLSVAPRQLLHQGKRMFKFATEIGSDPLTSRVVVVLALRILWANLIKQSFSQRQ